MRRWLPAPVIGVLSTITILIALAFWTIPLMTPVALVKILVPALRRLCDEVLIWIASIGWVGTNRVLYTVLHGRRRNVSIVGDLDPRQSWLIVSNHQSWADILILFDVFFRRAPFPRFFMKRELIWVPVVGYLCWALDMPFMRRSAAGDERSRNEDLETTRRFCEKFRRRPITVVNFAEGTRCTEAKRIGKNSPYRHLLRPKSGGLSFTLNAMGEQFGGLVDTTLIYAPTGGHSKLWSFLCGDQTAATVQVRVLPLPRDVLAGDYQNDDAFRAHFQHWLNALWAEKDAAIAAELELAGRARE